jgi:hypothetical protein
MDKIKQLLKKLGASEELTKSIVESLDEYAKGVQDKNLSEYKTRLAKAKEVCIEAVEDYKKELARKVQLFFEARADKIDQQISKQVAIKESAAEAKLNKVAALVEGIEVNGVAEADLKALKENNLQLKKQLKAIVEERDLAVEKANRATGIAERALKRTRILESQITEDKTQTKVEPKVEPKTEKLTEGKTEVVTKPIAEAKSEKPKTTRKAAAESIVSESKTEAPAKVVSGWDPGAIATQMTDLV